jgi:hypothetical protein
MNELKFSDVSHAWIDYNFASRSFKKWPANLELEQNAEKTYATYLMMEVLYWRKPL